MTESVRDKTTSGDWSTKPLTRWLYRHRFWLIIIVVALNAVAGFVFATLHSPRPVSRYDELSRHIGKSVTFQGVFDDSSKEHAIISLEGKPIRFYHTLGVIDWSPDLGEECRVVGVIEHQPDSISGIPFCLMNAEYYSVRPKAAR